MEHRVGETDGDICAHWGGVTAQNGFTSLLRQTGDAIQQVLADVPPPSHAPAGGPAHLLGRPVGAVEDLRDELRQVRLPVPAAT